MSGAMLSPAAAAKARPRKKVQLHNVGQDDDEDDDGSWLPKRRSSKRWRLVDHFSRQDRFFSKTAIQISPLGSSFSMAPTSKPGAPAQQQQENTPLQKNIMPAPPPRAPGEKARPLGPSDASSKQSRASPAAVTLQGFALLVTEKLQATDQTTYQQVADEVPPPPPSASPQSRTLRVAHLAAPNTQPPGATQASVRRDQRPGGARPGHQGPREADLMEMA